MYHVVAYQVASTINIKKSIQLPWQLLFKDSDELYFEVSKHKFIYVFQYGMVSFFNMSQNEILKSLKKIKPFCADYFSEKLTEEVKVVIQKDQLQVSSSSIILPCWNQEMIRLVMLNASQSVALDRFSEITENLLIETNEHTKYLEKFGKLDISGNKLKRFIDKVLNIKNKISENLYIFDTPEFTWENETLQKLNLELKQAFDLKDRYRLIHNRIEIIKENLELFKDIMDHNESSRLEWIIIILILVEVIDMFVLKIY
jgi:uncharacterized Rmd1/YagE family protein